MKSRCDQLLYQKLKVWGHPQEWKEDKGNDWDLLDTPMTQHLEGTAAMAAWPKPFSWSSGGCPMERVGATCDCLALCAHTAGISDMNCSDPIQNPFLQKEKPFLTSRLESQSKILPSRSWGQGYTAGSKNPRTLSSFCFLSFFANLDLFCELNSQGRCVALQYSCSNSDESGLGVVFRRCWWLLWPCQAKCHCVVAVGITGDTMHIRDGTVLWQPLCCLIQSCLVNPPAK